MRYIILGHLGLGDNIVINGFIHYLRKVHTPEEICILALEDKKPTLQHLYSDFPGVTFYWLDSSWPENPVVKEIDKKPKDYILQLHQKQYRTINFGLHSASPLWLHPRLSWADSFYLQWDVSPRIRFSAFTLPNDMSYARYKYNSLLQLLPTSKYVLVHDDPSRQRYINPRLLKDILHKDNMLDLPILYLGKNRYSMPLMNELQNINADSILSSDSLLDLADILRNATACHFMDSSIACLTDVLGVTVPHLYIHSYITTGEFRMWDKPHMNANWTYLTATGSTF